MKNKADKEIIALLVRVYNHSIQSYYHFPDVIIYGNHRLDKEEFETLLQQEFVTAYYSDSFGKLYRLSKSAEEFLYASTGIRKRKHNHYSSKPARQCQLQFC